MADDDLLDLDEEQQEAVNKVEKRIKGLSEKVKLTAQERDELAEAKQELEEAKAKLEKERDFFKNFNTVSSKYDGASEFQEQILEKVNSGYELEDAAIAILAKEGRYVPPAQPEPSSGTVAGGSASTGITYTTKSPSEMDQDELRSALADAERRGEFKL